MPTQAQVQWLSDSGVQRKNINLTIVFLIDEVQ